MPHMVESMAYVGERPWHGLGVKVPEDITPGRLLEVAGLDWEVQKFPVYAEVNGEQIEVPNQKALIRMDNGRVLDMVSDDWMPVQNHEAFEFFTEFVTKGSVKMETAGSLDEGRMTWALAKVADYEFFGNDTHEGYLLFSNPHKYGQAITIGFTPVRVVCNNTLSLALRGNMDFKVKFRHNALPELEYIKSVIRAALGAFQKYREAAEFLGSKPANDESINEYLAKLFPYNGKKGKELSTPAKTVKVLLDVQPGAEIKQGSWWQVFNAVTFYNNHVRWNSNGNKAERRFKELMYGRARQKNNEALKLALKMAA